MLKLHQKKGAVLNKFWSKVKESLISVLPILAFVMILNFTVTPLPGGTIVLFLTGSFMLILGMGLFMLGADIAMLPMGELMGAHLTKLKNKWILFTICFILGVMITIAEPDLQILAVQVPTVPNRILILSVSIGVGFFLVAAVIRILYQIQLSYMMIFFYTIVFILSAFSPEGFLAMAFDSGGVATGPIVVPFILALGVGLSSVLGGKASHDDSFGLIALCLIGPIIAVLIMGIFYDSSSSDYGMAMIAEVSNVKELLLLLKKSLPLYIKDVAIALFPIVFIFLLFQFFIFKLSKQQLIKIGVGVIYTYLGLVLFLTGVNIGFMPAGNYIGQAISYLPYNWILLPLGALMGAFVVIAEPTVHVLNNQVENITGGAISKRVMMIGLSIGVGFAVAISIFRIFFGISILYILLPGYAFALILTFFVPKIFSAIAFDSGTVASGPMCATFLLPFAIGACEALGGNILTDAFGIVATVTMTPLIAIQIMGIIYKMKIRRMETEEENALQLVADLETENYYMNLEDEGKEA